MGARAEEHQGHPVPPHGAAAHRLPTSSQTSLIRLSRLQPTAQNYRRKSRYKLQESSVQKGDVWVARPGAPVPRPR